MGSCCSIATHAAADPHRSAGRSRNSKEAAAAGKGTSGTAATTPARAADTALREGQRTLTSEANASPTSGEGREWSPVNRSGSEGEGGVGGGGTRADRRGVSRVGSDRKAPTRNPVEEQRADVSQPRGMAALMGMADSLRPAAGVVGPYPPTPSSSPSPPPSPMGHAARARRRAKGTSTVNVSGDADGESPLRQRTTSREREREKGRRGKGGGRESLASLPLVLGGAAEAAEGTRPSTVDGAAGILTPTPPSERAGAGLSPNGPQNSHNNNSSNTTNTSGGANSPTAATNRNPSGGRQQKQMRQDAAAAEADEAAHPHRPKAMDGTVATIDPSAAGAQATNGGDGDGASAGGSSSPPRPFVNAWGIDVGKRVRSSPAASWRPPTAGEEHSSTLNQRNAARNGSAGSFAPEHGGGGSRESGGRNTAGSDANKPSSRNPLVQRQSASLPPLSPAGGMASSSLSAAGGNGGGTSGSIGAGVHIEVGDESEGPSPPSPLQSPPRQSPPFAQRRRTNASSLFSIPDDDESDASPSRERPPSERERERGKGQGRAIAPPQPSSSSAFSSPRWSEAERGAVLEAVLRCAAEGDVVGLMDIVSAHGREALTTRRGLSSLAHASSASPPKAHAALVVRAAVSDVFAPAAYHRNQRALRRRRRTEAEAAMAAAAERSNGPAVFAPFAARSAGKGAADAYSLVTVEDVNTPPPATAAATHRPPSAPRPPRLNAEALRTLGGGTTNGGGGGERGGAIKDRAAKDKDREKEKGGGKEGLLAGDGDDGDVEDDVDSIETGATEESDDTQHTHAVRHHSVRSLSTQQQHQQLGAGVGLDSSMINGVGRGAAADDGDGAEQEGKRTAPFASAAIPPKPPANLAASTSFSPLLPFSSPPFGVGKAPAATGGLVGRPFAHLFSGGGQGQPAIGPFHAAAREGHVDVIEYLSKMTNKERKRRESSAAGPSTGTGASGAHVSNQGQGQGQALSGINEVLCGRAPLHEAIARGHHKCVYQMIQQHGASVTYPGAVLVRQSRLAEGHAAYSAYCAAAAAEAGVGAVGGDASAQTQVAAGQNAHSRPASANSAGACKSVSVHPPPASCPPPPHRSFTSSYFAAPALPIDACDPHGVLPTHATVEQQHRSEGERDQQASGSAEGGSRGGLGASAAAFRLRHLQYTIICDACTARWGGVGLVPVDALPPCPQPQQQQQQQKEGAGGLHRRRSSFGASPHPHHFHPPAPLSVHSQGLLLSPTDPSASGGAQRFGAPFFSPSSADASMFSPLAYSEAPLILSAAEGCLGGAAVAKGRSSAVAIGGPCDLRLLTTGGGDNEEDDDEATYVRLFCGDEGMNSEDFLGAEEDPIVPAFCPLCCVEEQPLHLAAASGDFGMVLILLESVVTAVCSVMGTRPTPMALGQQGSVPHRLVGGGHTTSAGAMQRLVADRGQSLDTPLDRWRAFVSARRSHSANVVGGGSARGGWLPSRPSSSASIGAGGGGGRQSPLVHLAAPSPFQRPFSAGGGGGGLMGSSFASSVSGAGRPPSASASAAANPPYIDASRDLGLDTAALAMLASFANTRRFADGYAPLHAAAAAGHADIVDVLMAHCGDPLGRAVPSVSAVYVALEEDGEWVGALSAEASAAAAGVGLAGCLSATHPHDYAYSFAVPLSELPPPAAMSIGGAAQHSTPMQTTSNSQQQQQQQQQQRPPSLRGAGARVADAARHFGFGNVAGHITLAIARGSGGGAAHRVAHGSLDDALQRRPPPTSSAAGASAAGTARRSAAVASLAAAAVATKSRRKAGLIAAIAGAAAGSLFGVAEAEKKAKRPLKAKEKGTSSSRSEGVDAAVALLATLLCAPLSNPSRSVEEIASHRCDPPSQDTRANASSPPLTLGELFARSNSNALNNKGRQSVSATATAPEPEGPTAPSAMPARGTGGVGAQQQQPWTASPPRPPQTADSSDAHSHRLPASAPRRATPSPLSFGGGTPRGGGTVGTSPQWAPQQTPPCSPNVGGLGGALAPLRGGPALPPLGPR